MTTQTTIKQACTASSQSNSSQSNYKPLKIKEWAIERLKQGCSPTKVSNDIEKLFGEYVSFMSIYRWKKQYIASTGENIQGWFALNKTHEQKANNRGRKRKANHKQ